METFESLVARLINGEVCSKSDCSEARRVGFFALNNGYSGIRKIWSEKRWHGRKIQAIRILEFFERSFDVSGCCMSRRSEIFFSNNSQKFLSKFWNVFKNSKGGDFSFKFYLSIFFIAANYSLQSIWFTLKIISILRIFNILFIFWSNRTKEKEN